MVDRYGILGQIVRDRNHFIYLPSGSWPHDKAWILIDGPWFDELQAMYWATKDPYAVVEEPIDLAPSGPMTQMSFRLSRVVWHRVGYHFCNFPLYRQPRHRPYLFRRRMAGWVVNHPYGALPAKFGQLEYE